MITNARYNFNLQYLLQFGNARTLGQGHFSWRSQKLNFCRKTKNLFYLVLTIEFSISGRVGFVVSSLLDNTERVKLGSLKTF
jgi:hypothetical protein